MKKALLVLLLLAFVAGGLFAQFSITGLVNAGIGMYFWDTDEGFVYNSATNSVVWQNDPHPNAEFGVIGKAEHQNGGRAQVQVNYTNEAKTAGAMIRMRYNGLNTGIAPSTGAFEIHRAEAWVSLFSNKLTVYGGRLQNRYAAYDNLSFFMDLVEGRYGFQTIVNPTSMLSFAFAGSLAATNTAGGNANPQGLFPAYTAAGGWTFNQPAAFTNTANDPGSATTNFVDARNFQGHFAFQLNMPDKIGFRFQMALQGDGGAATATAKSTTQSALWVNAIASVNVTAIKDVVMQFSVRADRLDNPKDKGSYNNYLATVAATTSVDFFNTLWNAGVPLSRMGDVATALQSDAYHPSRGIFTFYENFAYNGIKNLSLNLGFVESVRTMKEVKTMTTLFNFHGQNFPVDTILASSDMYFRMWFWASYAINASIVPRLDAMFISGGNWNPNQAGMSINGSAELVNKGNYTWNSNHKWLVLSPSCQFRVTPNQFVEVGYILQAGVGNADLYNATYTKRGAGSDAINHAFFLDVCTRF